MCQYYGNEVLIMRNVRLWWPIRCIISASSRFGFRYLKKAEYLAHRKWVFGTSLMSDVATAEPVKLSCKTSIAEPWLQTQDQLRQAKLCWDDLVCRYQLQFMWVYIPLTVKAVWMLLKWFSEFGCNKLHTGHRKTLDRSPSFYQYRWIRTRPVFWVRRLSGAHLLSQHVRFVLFCSKITNHCVPVLVFCIFLQCTKTLEYTKLVIVICSYR